MLANENVGYASGQTANIQGRNGRQIKVEMDVKFRSKWTPSRGRNGHQNEVKTDARPEAPPSSFSIFAATADWPAAAAKIEKKLRKNENN